MTGGNAIRATRLGGGPSGEAERGEVAPRQRVDYWCANGHRTRPSFALEAEVPESWECSRCGLPAGTDADDPPQGRRAEPYKSHLAYVKERRSDADGMALLEEALSKLKHQR